ncbi:hypothetical protein MIMGU_mgv1a015719mg [Erythranthe guttata]|uniref:Uncharacterized protein n=1 Tax=Erythranthe guttata TaxID=4155 RepID=A0A022RXG6_ERYGU|nr:hypothetical protein MIMGU_mgv1a015719mg [Erythranthe guttata]
MFLHLSLKSPSVLCLNTSLYLVCMAFQCPSPISLTAAIKVCSSRGVQRKRFLLFPFSFPGLFRAAIISAIGLAAMFLALVPAMASAAILNASGRGSFTTARRSNELRSRASRTLRTSSLIGDLLLLSHDSSIAFTSSGPGSTSLAFPL